jgi:hypothetical protein
MTTEQYQIGYEAGYSDGFDAGAALAEAIPQEAEKVTGWNDGLIPVVWWASDIPKLYGAKE